MNHYYIFANVQIRSDEMRKSGKHTSHHEYIHATNGLPVPTKQKQ